MAWDADLEDLDDSVLGELGEITAVYRPEGGDENDDVEVDGIFEADSAVVESLEQQIQTTKPVFITRAARIPAGAASEGDRLRVGATWYYITRINLDSGMATIILSTSDPR